MTGGLLPTACNLFITLEETWVKPLQSNQETSDNKALGEKRGWREFLQLLYYMVGRGEGAEGV
jgi:hypothetical protein